MSESKLYWWSVKDRSGECFRINAELAYPDRHSLVFMVNEDIVGEFTNWASYYREDVVACTGRIDVPSGSVYRNGPLPKVEPQDEEVAVDEEIEGHAEEPSGAEEDVAELDIRVGIDGRRWRRLGSKEVVQDGDWVNSKDNSPASSWPLALPPRGGWIPTNASVGRLVKQLNDIQEFIREVK